MSSLLNPYLWTLGAYSASSSALCSTLFVFILFNFCSLTMSEDSSDSMSRKRRRLTEALSDAIGDDATPSSLDSHLTRDEEFWFHDGTIVLASRDIGFKVYKGLLDAQSSFFRDSSSLSSPRKGQLGHETFEGCPAFRLSDSPEELRHLLRAILHGSNVKCVLCHCFHDSLVRATFSASTKNRLKSIAPTSSQQ